MSDAPKRPAGLAARGRALWDEITALDVQLDPAQLVILGEACRCVDRLEKLDRLLRGDADTWARLVHDLRTEDYELKVDGALSEARQQQNILKQLLVTLRLPDGVTNKRPKQIRTPSGGYAKGGVRLIETAGKRTGTVSSLDRARQASSS